MEKRAIGKLTVERHWEAWALAALLLVHIALGIYWSVAIPIWEAYDEIGHYYFVRYLATEHHLPPAGSKLVAENDESHQPPLYYALAAIPVSFVNVNDGVEPRVNPYMWWGPAAGGWNRVLHDPAVEGWPYRGTVLAVHLARWVSVLLGALALLCTFLAARLLAPGQPWVRWGAALVLAFWPHFRFSTAVINNDIMVTTVAAVVTWLLVRLIIAERPRALDLAALLLAGGLALLSKSNGLSLLPAVLAGLLICALRAKPAVRSRLGLGLLGGLAASVLAVGWWYVRNTQGGMGLFGGRRSLRSVGKIISSLVGQRPFHVELAWPALLSGLHSLWANFGWGNICLPPATYQMAGIWGVLGMAGLLLWLCRRPERRQATGVGMVALLAASVIGVMLLFRVAWANATLEGRYLLPALPALSVLLAIGWSALLPGRIRRAGWGLVAGALGGLALLTPWLYIQPAYAMPARLSEAQVADYVPVQARAGDFVELVGYQMDSRLVDPGGNLRLTLAWRPLAAADADYTLAVQVFGAHRRLLGEVQRFPGRGTLATSTWAAGQLYAEELVIPVESQEEQGQLAWVEVSFFEREGVRPVPMYAGDGRKLGNSLRLAQVKVRGTVRQGPAPSLAGLRFGPAINLAGGRAAVAQESGEWRLGLALDWAAVGQPEKDYTVSLQLRDAGNGVGPQVDSQPLQGAYPTSFWESGETIEDGYTLALPADLPAGTYTLYVCLYDLATLERLPVADEESQLLPNAEASLLTVLVQPEEAPALQARSPLMEIETR